MDTIRKITVLLHQKKIFYSIPVLFLIPPIVTRMHKELVIFPLQDTYTVYCYSDSSEEQGNSQVTRFTVDSSRIVFEYILREGNEYPYAGFQINVNTDSTFLDVSGYDYLQLNIEPFNSKKIDIYCKTYIDGFTRIDDYNTHRFLEKECDLTKDKTVYRIALDKFVTPLWWLNDNNLTETEIGEPDLSKIMNVAIANANYAKMNTSYTIAVTGISFTKDTTPAYCFTIIAIGLYFFLYWLVMVILKKRTAAPVVIPYKELEVESYVDEEAGRIVALIAKRYHESDLSVAKIGQDAGVLPARIPVILKKKFNMTFKQYLNNIRLSESKRLLRETDRQIADIAYNVGYKNVTHFHRIFKQFEKISPNEYRKSRRAKV